MLFPYGLQQTFAGLGDAASLARVKAMAHLHSMMVREATVAAYQDIFLLSAVIALFNLLPALLRRRATRVQKPQGETATAVTVKEGAHRSR